MGLAELVPPTDRHEFVKDKRVSVVHTLMEHMDAPSKHDDLIPTRESLLTRLKDWADADVDPASLALDSIWEAEWERSLFAAASERVKLQVAPEQFQIFDLYCIENWSVGKVTRTLGVSAAQVYLAKHRIGRLLKKQV